MSAVEIPGPNLLGGRYRLVERLGAGGMAVVWRGFDEVLGRQVAVKVLAPSSADDPAFRRRLRIEAQAAARLSHPNITSVYDYGESVTPDGELEPYVVMELVDGESLSAVLARQSPLPWPAAVRVCAEVAAGLAAAHARGIVHRDVAPANVMLTDGGAKVVDFGISALVGENDIDPDGSLLGTPAYLAPERLDGGQVSPATDVYAVGLLLYRCLTGLLPWDVGTTTGLLRAHQHTDPDPLPPIVGLPTEVADVCRRSLAKQPTERPPTHEVAEILAAVARQAPSAPLDVRTSRADGTTGHTTILPRADAPAPVSPAPDMSALVAPAPALAAPALAAPAPAPGAPAAVAGLAAPLIRPVSPGAPLSMSPVSANPESSGIGFAGTPSAADDAVLPGPVENGVRAPVPEPGDLPPPPAAATAAAPVPAARPRPRRRRAALVAAAVGALGVLGGVTALSNFRGGSDTDAQAPPLPGCTVHYAVQSDDGATFRSTVMVYNRAAVPLDGWELQFALPGDQKASADGPARLDQNGRNVTMSSTDRISANGSVLLEVTGAYQRDNATPASFALNDVACAVFLSDRPGAPLKPAPSTSAKPSVADDDELKTERQGDDVAEEATSVPTGPGQAPPAGQPLDQPSATPDPSSSTASPGPTRKNGKPKKSPKSPKPSKSQSIAPGQVMLPLLPVLPDVPIVP